MSISRFPGFEHLYTFRSSGSDRDFIADIDLNGKDPLAVTRGTEPVTQARAHWAMGRKDPGMVVWTRLVSPVLIHQSVARALRHAGVTGWSTFSVDICGKQGDPVEGYVGLVVTGRCGAIQLGRAVRVERQYPGGMFPVQRGLFFDEQSWDGADIFMPDGSAWILVSELAKEVLSASARGIVFERLNEVEQIPPEPAPHEGPERGEPGTG